MRWRKQYDWPWRYEKMEGGEKEKTGKRRVIRVMERTMED